MIYHYKTSHSSRSLKEAVQAITRYIDISIPIKRNVLHQIINYPILSPGIYYLRISIFQLLFIYLHLCHMQRFVSLAKFIGQIPNFNILAFPSIYLTTYLQAYAIISNLLFTNNNVYWDFTWLDMRSSTQGPRGILYGSTAFEWFANAYLFPIYRRESTPSSMLL